MTSLAAPGPEHRLRGLLGHTDGRSALRSGPRQWAKDGQSGACAVKPEIAGRALKRELRNGMRSAVGLKPPPPWLCFIEKRSRVKVGSGCSGKSPSELRCAFPHSGGESKTQDSFLRV